MSLFYSASRAGFFDDRIHAALPDDARPISAERHAELLAAQSAGQAIVADAFGRPVGRPPVIDMDRRRGLLVEAVKRHAAERILAVSPLWRQINDARDLPLSQGEARAAIESRFAAIDAIRAASDRLESRLATMTTRGLAQVDIASPSHWPDQGITA